MCGILPCPRTYFHERIRCRLGSAPTKQYAALHPSRNFVAACEQPPLLPYGATQRERTFCDSLRLSALLHSDLFAGCEEFNAETQRARRAAEKGERKGSSPLRSSAPSASLR